MVNTELMLKIAQALKKGGVEAARFEAKQIVEFSQTEDEALKLAEKRISGEPLQYLLGSWEFYGLPFYVGEGVLIPRADTETLVDLALEIIGDSRKKVVDLCSGSGAIAIAVAKNSEAEVTAVEKSDEAFDFLKRNAELNGVNVKCIKGDVFDEHTEMYDLILSNPPYIPTNVIESLSQEVKKEPKMALDGGEDGLIFYKYLTSYWKGRINKGGYLAVEIGYDQGESVSKLFEDNGFKDVKIYKDFSGNDRVIIGTVKD